MKFKHNKDRRDWNLLPDEYNTDVVEQLKRLVEWIDTFCQMVGWGEITITSYWRPNDSGSYHSILQAADIRTHDKPFAFKSVMMIFRQVFIWTDKTLWINVHRNLWNTPNEHIHVAIKDGKL